MLIVKILIEIRIQLYLRMRNSILLLVLAFAVVIFGNLISSNSTLLDKQNSPNQIQAGTEITLNLSVHELQFDSLIAGIAFFKQHFAIGNDTITFDKTQVEQVAYEDIKSMADAMRPYYTGKYFKGLKIYYTLESNNQVKLYYVPVYAYQDLKVDTLYNLSESSGNISDLIRSNVFDVYTLVGRNFTKINNDDSELNDAIIRFNRYTNSIYIKHNKATKFELFSIDDDARSSFFPIQLIDSLYANNNIGSTSYPDIFFYSMSHYPTSSSNDFRHSIVMTSEEVKPRSNPTQGNFTSKAANFNRLCPTRCSKIYVINGAISQ